MEEVRENAVQDERATASRLTVARYGAREWTAATVRRIWKSREVRPVRVRASLKAARIVVLMVLKNEAPRVPHLLEYYRAAGVDHFIIIDNESNDDLHALVAPDGDVSLFVAHGPYGAARYGMDWVNHVAGRHCSGKWLLHVDADELLVVPGFDGIRAVCDALDARRQRALHTVMLDMYSERPASTNIMAPGADPLEVCPLYDTTGYSPFYDPRSLTTWIKGGVRGQLFFDNIHDGPALNKTPLIRWRRHYAFAQGAHRLSPAPLNRQAPRPQGALLHFKFTSVSHAKFTDESNTAQHTAEYQAYSDVDATSLVSERTARWTSPDALVTQGILATLP